MVEVAEDVKQHYLTLREEITKDHDWFLFGFEEGNNNKIVFQSQGLGIESLKNSLADDKRHFAYLRLTVSDNESRRTKFVFISWVGKEVSAMAKAKMSVQKAFVKEKVQIQFAVEFHFEDLSEIAEEQIEKAVKLAGGADYSGQVNKN